MRELCFKKARVAGMPLWLYLVCLALALGCMYAGVIPQKMIPALLVLMVLGEGLAALGNTIPVIKTYFGDGYIKEWFEYDGEPGHFTVYSSNPSLTDERLTEFLMLLDKVKRASAKLDDIVITLGGQMNLSAGVRYREYGESVYAIGATL